MKFFVYIIMLGAGLVVNVKGMAQHQWHLEKYKNGIKVYSKMSDSSRYKSLKVDCVLNGTIDKLMAVLMNVSAHKNWVYEAKTSYVVKPISKTELVYYTETSLPFPVKNRDAVIHLTLKQEDKPNKVKIYTNSENGILSPKKGIVRIKSMKAYYDVTQEKDKIHIVYYLDIDPAGSIPAWIVNMFSTTGPYETFYSLGEELKKQQ